MRCELRIFHESRKPENAERAIEGMIRHNEVEIELLSVAKYLDKGCLAICEIEIPMMKWELMIYEVILFCQSFGHSWNISGQINEEINLSTTHVHAGNGITLVDFYLERRDLV